MVQVYSVDEGGKSMQACDRGLPVIPQEDWQVQKVLGDFSWVGINPGNGSTGLEKSNLDIMINRHSAVQLSLGRVQLRGLLDADKEILLDMELDTKGKERQPVMRLVRQIIAHQRVMGIKLLQCIVMRHDGIYEGFYTNDKGCGQHKEKASEFWGALGAHI